MFAKPVNTKEVPDYSKIIKQPMDLETMMTKVNFNSYECAKHFLDDIDLITQNALRYNSEKSANGKLIRQRACTLRDNAYASIKKRIDKNFEEECKRIWKNRKERAKFIPRAVHTEGE